ncbi:MAG: (2Fe-2S)-binding protein [Myxococcales bacterium]|nr:(2Fe-2S)-binding protein [Polyangiaceae bacterium]MDW8250634.1 (2Fe-2S)-binding protein [Myxococcales bacterium]
MYICLCKGVSERVIKACLREGARTVHQVGLICGAGTDCGACRGVLQEMIEEYEEELEGGRTHLPWVAPA